MIRLHIFPARLRGTPNPSPFCIKLETVLRLASVPHEIVYATNPAKAPKGKLPFIELEGERIGDSALILERLRERLGIDLDRELSDSERAQSHMIQRMLDERLYWVLVHSRWIEEANWPVVQKGFFGGMPFPLSRIVSAMARRQVRAALHAQGTGRHSAEEIYELGAADLAALAALLGEREFFFANTPSVADAACFAYLVSILGPDLDSPLKEAALRHANLVRHMERMHALYAATRQRRQIALTLAA